MSDELRDLYELRRQDSVLGAMQRMLNCKRRGLCLLREWIRRYGNPGSSCQCFHRFEEQIYASDLIDE